MKSPRPWITSKEVLLKTGVSRATLHNYIKMGLVTQPVVQPPKDRMKGIKKIGYFPATVLERVERIKELKAQGHSMKEIASRIEDSLPQDREEAERAQGIPFREEPPPLEEGESIRLTLDDIKDPAYLLDFDFQVIWTNHRAEQHVFGQAVKAMYNPESRNIFKIFFNWDFHHRIKNWRDVIALHMRFAKLKYTRSWIGLLYKGMTPREVGILQDLYDQVPSCPKQTVHHLPLGLVLKGGSKTDYMVSILFCHEGFFFVYGQPDPLWEKARLLTVF